MRIGGIERARATRDEPQSGGSSRFVVGTARRRAVLVPVYMAVLRGGSSRLYKLRKFAKSRDRAPRSAIDG